MPLSEDDDVNKTAAELVDTFRGAFHSPETERPAHARGQLVKGTFTPSERSRTLSTAPIFTQPHTQIVGRFSSSTGIADIADDNASANPRGFAIRFYLSKDNTHAHYDVITHSANGFVVRTGAELLDFFAANKAGTTDEFFAQHPESKAFVSRVPGFPRSFGSERYFGVNAFRFRDAEGKLTWYRYRVVPYDGAIEHYTQEEVSGLGKDYLYDELRARLAPRKSGGSVKFMLVAQIAGDGDVTDDATKVWPESRELVELGVIEIDEVWDQGGAAPADEVKEQKRIVFDPVPRMVDGIEAGDDPLIDMRAAVYLISGKKRRAANGVA